MVNPDLQIRGRGGGGVGGGLKALYSALRFGPQFGLKIKGAQESQGPAPGPATGKVVAE